MQKRKTLYVALVSGFFLNTLNSCEKAEVAGCRDAGAVNYNSSATASCAGCCEYNGNMVFWTYTGDHLGYVTIYVDNQYVGDITVDNPSAPDCNSSSGNVTFTGKEGSHTLYASEKDISTGLLTGKTWNSTFTITGKICKSKQLSK